MPILAGLAAAMLAQAATPPEMHYRLAIEERPGAAADAQISVDFTGQADGDTLITFPSEWGGEGELWNNLAEIGVSGDGAELSPGETPYQYVVRHAPGAALTLSYRIVQDRTGHPTAVADDNYRPWVADSYVHLLGSTVFAKPEGFGEARISFSHEAPNGWTFASDLDHGVIAGGPLMRSVIVAGDFRIQRHMVNGAPVRIAMRGDVGFDDESFAESVEMVVRANQAYWGDSGEPYLVTVLPLVTEPGRSSLGGTNLGDSFAFFATDNADTRTLLRILQHEHVHTWNPGRLGGGIPGAQEPSGYWFSEGVTDFLTQRVGVVGGVWDARTAIENWNEALAEYAASPLRDAPNDVITEQFWTSADAQRLPYIRGMMVAALIDHEIRTRTGGEMDLDDALRAMRSSAGDGPAPARFGAVTLGATGVDVSGILARHIEAGEPVLLPENAFPGCGVVETATEPVWDYGMEGAYDQDGNFVLVAVDPDGPAAPAGFAPGMIILERLAGAVGDATVDSVMRVQTPDGEVRDLRYRPTNGETVTIQRIRVDEAEFDEDACADSLAGR